MLLAVYNPNVEWLAKQLNSIERQDYPHVEVLVLDDGSDLVEEQTVRDTLRRCLKRVPYQYRKTLENQGSNRTFEQLTREADGDLVAYCDQDDIWEDEKLSVCLRKMKATGAGLVCCNAGFVGADGRELAGCSCAGKLADWIEKGSKIPLWQRLVFRNYAPGCSMLASAKLARTALPFPETMYHDHYLILWASLHAPVAVCREKLVRRRIHGENQTAFLGAVRTKEDYITLRIQKTCEILEELQGRLDCRDYLASAGAWSMARKSYASGGGIGALKKMMEGAAFNPRTTLFEAIFLPMPAAVWKVALNALHRYGR